MQVLVMYDIASSRLRLKVAETCLDYGLDRIQFSVFLGDLSEPQRRALIATLQDLIGDEPSKLCILPIPQNAMAAAFTYEQEAAM